jgi:hypothetical protein
VSRPAGTARLRLALIALIAPLAAGCATSRAAADSQLERMLGTWDARATTQLVESGQRLEVSSTTVVEWARPGEAVIERTVGQAAGESFTTLTLWMWDAEEGACRTWRLGADGALETGLARHAEGGERWELYARSESPTGEVLHGQGTLRFRSANEKDYEWVTTVDGAEVSRVEGTSVRRRSEEPDSERRQASPLGGVDGVRLARDEL